jgi:hypothetical protein
MNPYYDFTIPVFRKMLGGMKVVISKAQEQGISEETLLNDRLAPDMFPFVRQVQIACDNAKGTAARLSGNEVPSFTDTETTYAELYERIEKTLAYIESIPPEAYANATAQQIVLPYFPGMYMTGEGYAKEYAIPNFFFHVSMVYALARKNGAVIGKSDFLNGLPLKPVENA